MIFLKHFIYSSNLLFCLSVGSLLLSHCHKETAGPSCLDETTCNMDPPSKPKDPIVTSLKMASFGERLDNGMVEDYPTALFARDVNEDGKLDLIMARFALKNTDKKVSIYLRNKENTGFEKRNQIDIKTDVGNWISGSARFLQVGDFNEDGHLDLAVLTEFPTDFFILTGDGKGNFTFWQELDTGVSSNPFAIYLGSFVKGTKTNTDFLVVGYDSSKIPEDTIVGIVSKDKGSYQAPIIKRIPNGLSLISAVGDVNQDGITDVILKQSNTSSNGILLLGKGDGSLADPAPFSLPSWPDNWALGDWQKKGLLDVAMISDKSLIILPGDGKGNFDSPISAYSSTQAMYTWDFQLHHLNQDSFLDGIFSDRIHQNLQVIWGQGENGVLSVQPVATYALPEVFDVQDINGDKIPDIAVATDSATIGSILGKESGTGFEQADMVGIQEEDVLDITSGSFSENNGNELAILLKNHIVVWISDSSKKLITPYNFYPIIEYCTNSSSIQDGFLAAGNLNPKKDAWDDLVLVEKTPGQEQVQIRFSSGNSIRNLGSPLVYPLDKDTKPVATAITDINGDTNPDVVVLTQGPAQGSIWVLTGKGDGTFASKGQVFANLDLQNPVALAVADLNSDGTADLVVTQDQAITLLYTRQKEEGFSFESTIFRFGTRIGKAAIADLNQDKRLDIVVIYPEIKQAGILLNQGTGLFEGNSLSLDAEPGAFVIGDMNQDKALDIVVAYPFENRLAIVYGKGDGNFFETKQSLSVGSNPQSLVIRDFNQDGKLDLAVANQKSRTVSLLYNQTP